MIFWAKLLSLGVLSLPSATPQPAIPTLASSPLPALVAPFHKTRNTSEECCSCSSASPAARARPVAQGRRAVKEAAWLGPEGLLRRVVGGYSPKVLHGRSSMHARVRAGRELHSTTRILTTTPPPALTRREFTRRPVPCVSVRIYATPTYVNASPQPEFPAQEHDADVHSARAGTYFSTRAGHRRVVDNITAREWRRATSEAVLVRSTSHSMRIPR